MLLPALGLTLLALGNAEFSDAFASPENLMAAGGSTVKKWNYTVPFAVDAMGTSNLVIAATKWFNENTCLTFSRVVNPKNTTKPYLWFVIGRSPEDIKKKECSSPYGYTPSLGLAQTVYLNCASITEDVIREIAHALGLAYEHIRVDRDDKINVYPDKSTDPAAFTKRSFVNPPLEYDFGSVMHYHSTYKSSGGYATITAKDPERTHTIGTHRVQGFDIFGINRFYQCKNKNCKNAAAPNCKNEGEIHPKDCTACACPPMYRGKLCGARHPGLSPFNGVSCGGDYVAKEVSESHALYMKTINTSDWPAQGECYFEIKPASERVIKLTLNWYYSQASINKPYCDYGVQIYKGKFGSNPITFCSNDQIDSLKIREITSYSTIMIRMFRGHDIHSVDAVLGVTFGLV